MVNFLSCNVNGVRNFEKRKKMYRHVKENLKGGIVFMQETHCVKKDEMLWQNQWGGRCINSFGSTSSKGTSILFDRNLDYKLGPKTVDTEGRYVIVEIEIEQTEIVLGCVYAPNNDNPNFFTEFLTEVDKFQNPNIIIAGDFNLVFDTSLDRAGSSEYNHPNSLSVLCNFMENMELNDIWRIRNPDLQRYSCHKKNSLQFSRIDFFLVSSSLVQSVNSTGIKPSFCSDHSIISLELKLNSSRGPGFWKFNTSLLEDPEHNNRVQNAIDDAKANYQHESPALCWEMIKMNMAQASIIYSKEKASKKNKELKELQYEIEWFTFQLEVDPGGQQDQIEQRIESLKSKHDEIMSEKFKGAAFRSKCQWYEKGERSSRYFFNLEKSNYRQKTMSQAFAPDGSLVVNDKQVLDIQANYFSNLYEADPKVEFNINNNFNRHIAEDQANIMEREITIEELTYALASLNSGRTPGPDGLPPELYQHFWKSLMNQFHSAIRYAKQQGLLHISARRGIISLIPKKNRDNRFVENWRPITLLTTDYKILAKALVMRMQKSLGLIISPHQTGFLPGRKISHNIRKVLDIIEYMERHNQPGILLSLDFFKCFDTIAHNSIKKCLEFYGFKEQFIQYVMLLYQEITACVQNNGYISKHFPINRGSPQGSPISSVLYLICGQVMSDLLENNPQIVGLQIAGEEELLIQFADDTNLFLQYDIDVLHAVESTLEHVYQIIGLKVNYDKTVIYRLGSLKNTNAKLYTEKNVVWTNNVINILGVDITHNEDIVTRNFNTIKQKTEAVIALWTHRTLSLMGKVLLVNSLIASLFVYKMMVLPNLHADCIKQFTKSIRNFLWNNKKPRIALTILQADKSMGGLRLVNLKNKEISIKSLWIEQIHNNDSFFRRIFYNQLKIKIEDRVWECNLQPRDIRKICHSSFWADVLIAWFHYNKKPIDNVNKIAGQALWYNSFIIIDGRMVYNGAAWDAGLKTINNLYLNGTLMSHQQIVARYGQVLSWLEHRQLISAIPILWKQSMQRDCVTQVKLNYNLELVNNMSANVIYSHLLQDNSAVESKRLKWQKMLHCELEQEHFQSFFANIYKVTIATKFRSFQYNLLTHAIVTNHMLFLWKKKENDNCTFCNLRVENITHLFFECIHVQALWKQVFNWIQSINKSPTIEINTALDAVIFNDVVNNPYHVFNFIVLITKQFIYRTRCLNTRLSFKDLLYYIDHVYLIEEFIAKKNHKWNLHVRKWKVYKPSLQEENVQTFVHNYINNM